MKNELSFHAVLALILLLDIPTCRECVDAMGAPTGTSTMSAEIDGITETLTEIRPSNYLRFTVGAKSASHTIGLSLGYGWVGRYEWSASQGNVTADTSAHLDFIRALPGIGGCTITRSDNRSRVVEGFFDFKVFDVDAQDTIEVTNGKFILYYASED